MCIVMVKQDVMDKYDGQIYVISVTIISYVTLRILEIFTNNRE